MNEIKIPLRLMGKARPRFKFKIPDVFGECPYEDVSYCPFQSLKLVSVHTYTPTKTLEQQTALKWHFKSLLKGKKMIDKPVRLYIGVYFYNKSEKKKRGWFSKRPDFDNLAKMVADALQGIVIKDDSLIVSCTIEKFYSNSNNNYVIVKLEELNDEH